MVTEQKRPRRRPRRRRRRSKSLWRYLRKYKRKLLSLLKYVATALIAVCLTLVYQHYSAEEKPAPRKTVTNGQYHGIDVSKFQGAIDWKRVANDENIQFVYIKASEGASSVDARYKENFSKAKKAGLKVGSYHYFLGWKPAKEQFDNFNRYVDRSKQDLIPMVDVELMGNRNVSRELLQSRLAEFMQLVKEEYGKYPLLYSQYRFYNDNLAPEFNKYFIFIARYSSKEPTLKGAGKYNIWQYSEKGRVDGIKGAVDLDRFANGTTITDIEL